MNTKLFYSLSLFCGLFLSFSCTREGGNDQSILDEEIQNQQLLNYLQSKLLYAPETKVSLMNLVDAEDLILWEYVESSHSGLCGNYFAIPVKNVSEGKIDRCVIIPVIAETEGDYSIAGTLEMPFIFGEEELNETPEEYRYLFSLLFWQWQDKGLEVKQELTDYARQLYNNYVPWENAENVESPSSSPNNQYTIRYVVDYRVYGYSYGDGETVHVIEISGETLEKIFRDATRVITSYSTCKGCEIKNISPLVMDVKVDNIAYQTTLINAYMACVETLLWQECNQSTMDYQHSAYIYPTWHDISGGTPGGGGGTGGGSSSGEPSSGGSGVVDPSLLESNEYINSVYEGFERQSPTFYSYLKKFMKENSIVNLRWEYSDTLGSNVAGMLVSGMQNYWLVIQLNKNVLKKYPALFVAKTMLHELMHADVMVKLMSLKESNPANMTREEFESLSKSLEKQDYPTLYYYYNKYIFNATSQHAYMSDYQVDIIAEALCEFMPSAGEDVCEAIAWQGLQWMLVAEYNESEGDWVFYKRSTPGWESLGPQKQEQINNTYKSYLNSTPPGYPL